MCVFTFTKYRQTIKYLEFLSLSDATNRSESKFDYDPSFSENSSGCDIVYKILGIEPNETMQRAPSIIISKKIRHDQETDVDVIEEEEQDALGPPNELENLKNLFQQEDLRDVPIHPQNKPNIRNKMKKITTTSKNLLNKKVTQVKLMSSSSHDPDDLSLHESHSDITLYKPVKSSLRESAAELGSNIIRKVKRSHQKYSRSNDGVGMATLLVRSMMAAPSLDSIAENTDQTATLNAHNPVSRDALESSSMISFTMKKPPQTPVENKLNISVGDSIIDLKSYDGNLSSGVSMSSVTMSDTSTDDDDCSELGDEVVMIDADTISM